MAASLKVVPTKSKFYVDQRELLVQNPVVGEFGQIGVLTSLQERILYLARHPHIAGHENQRWMYDTMGRTYWWPHTASTVHSTITKCKRCARSGSQFRYKHPFQLFPASKFLYAIAMDKLKPFPKTSRDNRHVCVTTNRYSILIRAIPMS